MKLLEIISDAESGQIDQNLKSSDKAGSRARALAVGEVISAFLSSVDDRELQIINWDQKSGKTTEELPFAGLVNTVADCILEERHCNMIRSAYSCRFISFGYDRQVHFCIKSEDGFEDLDHEGIVVSDVSKLLIKTDFFDGL